VEYPVHRGAAVALATTKVQLGHELRFLVGFPEGERVVDHKRLVKDFDEVANAIIIKVLAEEVILEAP
jgi:hypothetical protein